MINETKTIISPVTFLGQSYDVFEYLLEAFANNFDEAVVFFTKNSIISCLTGMPQEKIDVAIEFEAIYKNTKDKKVKDKLLFEFIYTIYPEYTKICFKTIKAYTLYDFVNDLSNKLETKKITDKEFSIYEQLVENRIISSYLKFKQPENQELINSVSELEKDKTNFISSRNKQKTFYTLCYILSERKEYNLDAITFTSKDEFVDYVEMVYKMSFNELNKLCKKLISRRLLDVKLEAWLYSLGYKEELKLFNDKIATNIDSLIDDVEESE